jgi:AmmeMemoRadiSam system protein B
MSVRNAAVAGMFYPAGKEQLKSDIDALLEHAPTPAGPVPKESTGVPGKK